LLTSEREPKQIGFSLPPRDKMIFCSPTGKGVFVARSPPQRRDLKPAQSSDQSFRVPPMPFFQQFFHFKLDELGSRHWRPFLIGSSGRSHATGRYTSIIVFIQSFSTNSTILLFANLVRYPIFFSVVADVLRVRSLSSCPLSAFYVGRSCECHDL